ncbi:MAG: hypothetical protein IJ597_02280 [Synergistaceae bacterium]|nr:hypothetical protein [Synergistaceae bacterium]
MSENLRELYNKTDFIITGGALEILTGFLNEKGIKALVVEKANADSLNVIDAAGVVPTGLSIKNCTNGLFSAGVVKDAFEINFAKSNGEWPGVIRFRGAEWEIYILLQDLPADSDALIEELKPCAGLIAWWQTFKKTSEMEKKLSRLSYMILATKSTLASIFEPMPLQYFASFLADVLQESLFPKSVAILKDEGNYLTVIHGNVKNIPERKGIFASLILPPNPVVTQKDSYVEIVLPVAEGDSRLFALMEWEKLPNDQTLNFLELLGNLAVRAIAINNLRQKSRQSEANMSSGEFTILSLSNVLKVLRGAESKEKFISLLVDFFIEQGRLNECILATWDKNRKGYAIAEHMTGRVKAHDSTLLPSSQALTVEKVSESYYDLSIERPDDIFKTWGFGGCPWSEFSRMKFIFPICNDTSLVGFIALGAEQEGPALDRSELTSLQLIAQFAAYEFRRFE